MKGLKKKGAFGLLLAASVLAGCSMSAGNVDPASETGTLRVMYYDERQFFQDYGMLFSALHPTIDIEVISTNSIRPGPEDDYQKMMEDFLEEQKPDVMMVDPSRYETYAEEGKLLPLDPLITRDQFDLEGIVPGIVEQLREKGGGQLYGLAPEFYAQALFYNKALFDAYGISHPTDRMSWEEVLQLAARFPSDGTDEDRIYGLKYGYQMNLFQLGTQIGATNELTLVDPTTMTVTIGTEGWKAAFDTALSAINSNQLYQEDPMRNMSGSMTYEDFLLRDPFIGGKVAMTIDGFYLLQQIKEAQSAVKDRAVSDWDLVTVPVNPLNPDYSPNGISFHNIFVIDASTPNKEAAWKFVKYIHSDEFARVKSKSHTGNFPVRTNYIEAEDGRNMQAFYMLKPSLSNLYAGMEDVPSEFMMQFWTMAEQELAPAVEGTVSVTEALDLLQVKLQAALNEALENQPEAPEGQ